MKHQIPTSKLQNNSKHQAPTSKLQRSSKDQAPKSLIGVRKPVRYSTPAGGVLLLNEAPAENGVTRHPFDLEERTASFGEEIVRFSRTIPRDPTNNRLIDQLVGCGTSIGGNYCEANEGVSKKDFRNVYWSLCKGSKGNKIFPSHDRRFRTEACPAEPRPLSRSERTTSDFREHFSENEVSIKLHRKL